MMQAELRLISLFMLTMIALQADAQSRIVFHGNRVFSSRELTSIVTHSDSLAPDSASIHERLSLIVDSLIARDRLFARIDCVQTHSDRKDRPVWHVYLDEGETAKIRSLSWLGDSARVPPATFRRALCRTGGTFRWADIAIDADAIVTAFEAIGYPFARVDVDWSVSDSAARAIDVNFLIHSGPYTSLQFIEFPGNRQTKISFLFRETRLRIGEAYNQRRIDDARRRLARLDFIRRVEKPHVLLNSVGQTGIRIPVEEGRSTRIDAVAGYVPAGENGKGVFNGLVNLELLNLFGSGRRARVHWERPDVRVQSVDVAYREPWIFDQPLALRFDFGQRVEDTLYVSRRIAARVEVEFGTRTSVWGSVQSESVFSDSASAAILNLPDYQTTYTEAGFALESRDHPTNPRSGAYFSTFAGTGWRKREKIGTMSSGSFRQHRLGMDSEIAQELFGSWILDGSVHARALETTEPEVLLPDFYRLGGARTLRGYREEQFIGSRVGWASTELRYWLGPASRVFLFCDAGGIYREKSGPEENTLVKVGAGFGLRLETNIGVWGFDYGIGEEDRLLSGKLHISLQSSF